MSGFAWVTLATNDSYSLGALVLAHSLQQVGTAHQLAVLVTPGVSAVMRERLGATFNVVKEVNVLDSRDEANLRLLQRPDLGITFTKLHCWRLTEFQKCVFLDADTFVLQNADELFEREEFSAAPDVGWPDCFNSGVFVYRPSEETYTNLVRFALEKGSFDGGDQGLLNLYFSDWAHKDISKHLPFIYNMCSTACYSYLPAYKQFGGNAKIIHFIGPAKPWLQYFDTETWQVHVQQGLQHLTGIVQHWWNVFCSMVHPVLSSEMTRSSSAHYISTTSNIRSVPIHYNPPDQVSTKMTIHTEDINHHDSKFHYKTAWDPWDDYENTSKEIEHNSHNSHTRVEEHNFYNTHTQVEEHNFYHTHTQVNDCKNIDENHNTEIVVHHKETVQPNCFNNSCKITTFANHHVTKTISNDENVEQYHHVQIDNPSRFHESEHFSPSQTVQESLNIESQITAFQTPECNQPACPHEFEPVSCVTTENALHEKPNEADDSDAGLAGAFARLTLGVARTAEQNLLEDHLRRQGWEVGNIDYMGRDSFDNIWSKICETLASGPSPTFSEPHSPAPASVAPIVQIPEPVTLTEQQVDTLTKETASQIGKAISSDQSVETVVAQIDKAIPSDQSVEKIVKSTALPTSITTVSTASAVLESTDLLEKSMGIKLGLVASHEKVAKEAESEKSILEPLKIASPQPEAEKPAPPQPEATKPAPPQPEAARPAPPQPEAAKPAPPQPEAIKPAPPQPEVAKPAPPRPEATKPAPPQPEAAKPAPPQPEVAKPAPPRPEATKPAPPQPEAAKPAPPQPEATKPAPPQPEATKPAPPQPEAAKPTPPQPEAAKPAPPQLEGTKPAPPQPEAAKPETPKQETVKPSTPKVVQSKQEISKPETPIQETSKPMISAPGTLTSEAPKPKMVKPEPPKPEIAKVQSQKPEIPKQVPQSPQPKPDAPKPAQTKPELSKSVQSKTETTTPPERQQSLTSTSVKDSASSQQLAKSTKKESSESKVATQPVAPSKSEAVAEKATPDEGVGAPGPVPPPRKSSGGTTAKKPVKGKK